MARPPRRRLRLSAPVAEILDRSGFGGWDDDAGWRLTGHVFGVEIAPRLVEILLFIDDLNNVRLMPGLTTEEAIEAKARFQGILDKAQDALADAAVAAALTDHAFIESVLIVARALHDETTGLQTRQFLMDCRRIDGEARAQLAQSGGTFRDLDGNVSNLGAATAGFVRSRLAGANETFSADDVRNLLRSLGYLSK